MEYRKIFDCRYEDYERLKAPPPQKGPVFAPLHPSIAWPNEADIAPESPYEILLQKEQNRKSTWERETPASHIDPEDQQ